MACYKKIHAPPAPRLQTPPSRPPAGATAGGGGVPAATTRARPDGTCELLLDGRIAGIYAGAAAAEAGVAQFRRLGVAR
jgi:hypothetical protein